MAKSEGIGCPVSRLVETIVIDRDSARKSARRRRQAMASLRTLGDMGAGERAELERLYGAPIAEVTRRKL